MQIDVDFEVYKALTMRRADEATTENDVLRELLGLTKAPKPIVPTSAAGGSAWTRKGITLPHGTRLRAIYRGKEYTGVIDDGALLVDGVRYPAPSPAAMAITGNNVNGWDFWQAEDHNKGWRTMNSYRGR